MAKRVRTLRAFVEKIDFPRLRKQRALLRALVQRLIGGDTEDTESRQAAALDGLTNLLDDLSDDAAALLGDKVVFGDGTNQGCLHGIKCPHCGNEARFHISGESTFDVSDDGTDGNGDIEWNSMSWIQCAKCEEDGEMWEFQA